MAIGCGMDEDVFPILDPARDFGPYSRTHPKILDQGRDPRFLDLMESMREKHKECPLENNFVLTRTNDKSYSFRRE